MEEYSVCLKHMKLLLMIAQWDWAMEDIEDVSMSQGTRQTAMHSDSTYNQF